MANLQNNVYTLIIKLDIFLRKIPKRDFLIQKPDKLYTFIKKSVYLHRFLSLPK